ncbi:MAG: type I DNA topoisomerase [Bacteroidales bacterium]|nr:type I DNA topoisomerase [Bacteroidales bacterium]
MSKNLIIVESPAKAKTIQKFIGKDYEVISSKGHVRDLPAKGIGIDIKHNFAPQYEILDDKKKLIADIKKLSGEAETVWLATDDDREGEAISWHLMEAAKIPASKIKRIVFHEITKTAIEHALQNPRQLDIDLVNAQQARRVLDRLVGFELSPVLWRKVKPSLSAGRVQSVAVRLIVEREHEIAQFDSKSAYKTSALFKSEDAAKNVLEADLNKSFETEKEALEFLEACKSATFKVSGVEKSPGKKSPAPPFTTSTLQQEASRKLGFSVSKTMIVAQQLYEAGYITYMRTDSVNLSSMAIHAAKEEIISRYGADYSKTRRYVTKSKGAQEAHEAIRPTQMNALAIQGDSSAKRLYELIWKRTIASQMSDAATEKTTITIPVSNRPEKFICTGEVILFQGFLKVYTESKDEEDEEVKGLLPLMNINETVHPQAITAKERYAQPPARYSEASLVKKLEELGIGRPSTYAPTISTIQKREYVTMENRAGKERTVQIITLKGEQISKEKKKETYGAEKSKLFPTDIGIIVNDYLEQNFSAIMDYSFTASVEEQFDEVAEGKIAWPNMLNLFYGDFHTSINQAIEHSAKASGERSLGVHPDSGQPVLVKLGKYGPMAQIGDSSDGEQKPRYARLHKNQSIETITLEEALELFRLPRSAGEFEGQEITIGLGRFGPYIKHDKSFVSLPKTLDPCSATLEECIEAIEAKRNIDKSREPVLLGLHEGKELYKATGRYGPYLKYNDKNTTLSKDINIMELTLEQAIEHLNSTGTKNVIREFSEDSELRVLKGRYGAYIAHGKSNYKIPKEYVAENLTYADCQAIISNSKPTERKRVARKKS